MHERYHTPFLHRDCGIYDVKVTSHRLAVLLSYYWSATSAIYITFFWILTINFCVRKLSFCICPRIFWRQCTFFLISGCVGFWGLWLVLLKMTFERKGNISRIVSSIRTLDFRKCFFRHQNTPIFSIPYQLGKRTVQVFYLKCLEMY